ncbi:SH3 domain-containing protein [bacterium]|nr:SH3 domain-containing protein [bacterium]
MRKLLFYMAMNILLMGHVATVYAADESTEEMIVEFEKPAAETKALPVEGNSSVPMPPPRDESWKKGVNAFGNYNYEQAVFCFIESPSPLAKYYLAKIYFGDVFMNNLSGTSLPEINQQKAVEVLDTVINYKEAQELKNKYTSLINSPEVLSRFYYERGNYEEAEKAIEHVQGKEAEEIRHKYQLYVQSLKNPAPAYTEEAVFSEKPELRLPPEKSAPENTKLEPTFVEEKSKGHESFSESACFVDGHQQQISDENDEMIVVDSHPSSAGEHHPSEHKQDKDIVPAESVKDSLPQKGNVLVSIKPAIVWDWPALPGYDYKPVAKIATETRMVLLDDTAVKWYYKVELPDSKVGYICSYLVKRVDNKESKKSVQRTKIIEECSEYVNYLVDRHEEKKKAVKPKSPVKKKKPIVKKAPVRKQPQKSSVAHTVKHQAQPEVIFMNEEPVQHSSPIPSPNKSVHTTTEGGKH